MIMIMEDYDDNDELAKYSFDGTGVNDDHNDKGFSLGGGQFGVFGGSFKKEKSKKKNLIMIEE